MQYVLLLVARAYRHVHDDRTTTPGAGRPRDARRRQARGAGPRGRGPGAPGTRASATNTMQ